MKRATEQKVMGCCKKKKGSEPHIRSVNIYSIFLDENEEKKDKQTKEGRRK